MPEGTEETIQPRMEPRYHKSVKSYAPVNRLRRTSVCKGLLGSAVGNNPCFCEEHRTGQRENLFSVAVSTEASTNSMKFLELKVKKPLHTLITECGLSYSITMETSEEIQSS